MKRNARIPNQDEKMQKFLEVRDAILRPYRYLEAVLVRPVLSVGEVAEVVNVTKTMILNWDKYCYRVSEEEAEERRVDASKRKWNRYPIVTCISFGVLRILKDERIAIKRIARKIVGHLEINLVDPENLADYFHGRPLVLRYDFREDIWIHQTSDWGTTQMGEFISDSPFLNITVPLNKTISDVFAKLKDHPILRNLKQESDTGKAYYRCERDWVQLQDIPEWHSSEWEGGPKNIRIEFDPGANSSGKDGTSGDHSEHSEN